jgi:hypothetical protein
MNTAFDITLPQSANLVPVIGPRPHAFRTVRMRIRAEPNQKISRDWTQAARREVKERIRAAARAMTWWR